MCTTAQKLLRLVVFVLSSQLASATTLAPQHEPCADEKTSIHDRHLYLPPSCVNLLDEAVSFIQVGARRLARAAVTKASARNNQSKVASDRVESLQKAKMATSVSLQTGSMLFHLVSAQGANGIYLIVIVILAVITLMAICCALRPREAARDGNPGNIANSFPRLPQSTKGPYVRQTMPKFRAAPSTAQSSPDNRDSLLPAPRSMIQNDTYGESQGPSPSQRSLPRVSIPPMSSCSVPSPRPLVLPRVQGSGSRPPSRPGTSLRVKSPKTATKRDSSIPGGNPMMHLSNEERPPEVTGPRRPLPLCPMLVLPHCESFFAVPIDKLVAGHQTVEILGLSGNALLRATVKGTATGRIIEVSMSPPRSPPLASICEPSRQGAAVGAMELKGSRGSRYGVLAFAGNGFRLRCGEDDVMSVAADSNGKLQVLSCGTGDVLAEAMRSSAGENMFAADDLEVRVMPGMDAVLALLCVVSTLMFGNMPALSPSL